MYASSPPLIGITACAVNEPAGQSADRSHRVGEKYITAIADVSKGMPMLIPALPAALDLPALLAMLDGLLLTGSPSNVEPHHYDGHPSVAGTAHDPLRDAITLPLIRMAAAEGVPMLGLCRGHQELNVALGGTLHQRVHELPGRFDHRAPKADDWELKYVAAHPVALTVGGLLWELAGRRDEMPVNSLHAQAIDRVAPGLTVEAVAPDGTIEAVSLPSAKAFTVGVQFHPEFRAAENAFATALFTAFGGACRQRAALRRAGALERAA
jgi:putative glutamine amidotransferase